MAGGGEEEEVEEDEMGVAETYADYMPTKCEEICESEVSCILMCILCLPWCLWLFIIFPQ